MKFLNFLFAIGITLVCFKNMKCVNPEHVMFVQSGDIFTEIHMRNGKFVDVDEMVKEVVKALTDGQGSGI